MKKIKRLWRDDIEVRSAIPHCIFVVFIVLANETASYDSAAAPQTDFLLGVIECYSSS